VAKKRTKSTQRHLAIKEIRDGIIVLKSGGYRTVLMVNAINFHLKSRDEQSALMATYQGFLNGLTFPIQIVAQSRTLDLDRYLKSLEESASKQSNTLLRAQTNDYIGFVRDLIGVANIMNKTFYVIIPYETQILTRGFWAGLFGKKPPPKTLSKRFEKIRTRLLERTSIISNGLASLGLSNIQLNTQELVELFYSTYNPDTSRRQKLFSISNVDVNVIKNIQEAGK